MKRRRSDECIYRKGNCFGASCIVVLDPMAGTCFYVCRDTGDSGVLYRLCGYAIQAYPCTIQKGEKVKKKDFKAECWILFLSWVYEYMDKNKMDEITRPKAITVIKDRLEEEFSPAWDLLIRAGKKPKNAKKLSDTKC
jgi:hypothetical protein